MSLSNWISGRVFKFVHGNNLVYNTCWEDPRLDRAGAPTERSRSRPGHHICRMQCAGLCHRRCGARPCSRHESATDSLLEFEIAGIRLLQYEDFYKLFGDGYHPRAAELYQKTLRGALSTWAQSYWDRWIKFFDSPKRSFYFRGTSGSFARESTST